MVWNIGGSYYVRSGVQDSDETYGEPFHFSCDYEERHVSFEQKRLTRNVGILNHNWSDYRNAAVFKAGIGAMITASS
jgi:hypothetical protein